MHLVEVKREWGELNLQNPPHADKVTVTFECTPSVFVYDVDAAATIRVHRSPISGVVFTYQYGKKYRLASIRLISGAPESVKTFKVVQDGDFLLVQLPQPYRPPAAVSGRDGH
jgi:hypothetical protein